MTNNARPDFETPRVLHDSPLRSDDKHHFHFDQFAATLARLIASKTTRTPLTIGVSGSWGSGKTTLLQRVRQQLDATVDLAVATKAARLAFANDHDEPQKVFRVCRTVWFDAWRYTGDDQLLAALLRVIVAEMQASGFWNTLKSKQSGATDTKLDWLKVVPALTKFISAGAFELALDDVKVDTPLKSATAFFDYFDSSLDRLLGSWISGKFEERGGIDERDGALVIFIDDLDRCLPDKVVQVLETIKLFLDKQGCVFVLGADANVIREAVTSHYQNIHLTGESAGDYLEKIIQLRFELPPILTDQMGDFLQNDAEAKLVVDDEVRRHWPVLVTGAEINPRKVKTFINDVNLQWAMLKNSGQAQGIHRDDFTRWQVLMRAAPPSFVERVKAIDDVDLRHKFVIDALKWAQGESSLDATFQDYAGSLRLRRTLREIKAFDAQFTPAALDAFIHLTALPVPPSGVKEPAVKEPPVADSGVTRPEDEPEPARPEIVITRGFTGRDLTRGAKTPAARVQSWGGLQFVRVPAGKFLMGSKDDNQLAQDAERPQHTVEIPYDYWIAKFIVTNDHFTRFVDATRYVTTAEKEGGWSPDKHEFVKGFDWRHPLGPRSDLRKKADRPVVQVSWYDATAYCQWLTDVLRGELKDLTVRLPTEAEWEKAARGEYGNEWPWGNEFDQTRCNTSEGGKKRTTPTGTYSPRGDSPYGAVDMAGNVWEWCHSLYRPYPYQANDGREGEGGSAPRVLRGGSFNYDRWYARAARRFSSLPVSRDHGIGFRVVVSPGVG